ncbi:MAG: hypothetical protein JNK74_13885 [Candidatus Hydrogenedentes bacterium]|nr:hypothetical protein [Candidatus Hydrogenedentota bacterium]
MVKSISPCPVGFSLLQAILFLTPLLALVPAAAQDDTPDETILIDLTINHGVAYREGTWVPVDVFINNTERDIEGFVEVTTYDFSSERLSPVYRVPALSPKGSRKHFRLYCKLQQASRVEVQLYHGNRAAVPVPTWVNVAPIERRDYLGLVLDNNHHDYGFLSSEQVIGKTEVRFHREGLNTDQLGLLADRLPCYTAFDLIVMGDIDPERIAPEHRALLQQYVELGGTLAISLGENAARYKGSWLEPLMGVVIGENTFTPEDTLASQAFGRAGVAKREGMVTALSPAGEKVQAIGSNFTLGALNPVGNGRVATFTIDTVSGLMHNDPDFLRVWNDLLSRSIMDRPLNLPAVIDAAVQRLPALAGVKLFPVSSVITYLLLYFFIAIVGNWFFWNWMKRREMAWVCLVFFSLAFTSYAMIFGTQGRARSTKLEQLEILEVSANSTRATLHGVTGLLAKGSGRFEGTLIHPQTLASDVVSTVYTPDGVTFGSQSQSPFQFVQGEPGTVQNVAVGASEMRFLQTQAPLDLSGTLEADLEEADGKLRGTIQNKTGLLLGPAMLVYNGRGMALTLPDGTKNVDFNLKEFRGPRSAVWQLSPNDAMTVPALFELQERSQFSQFLSEIPQWLFSGNGSSPPPCLVAWVNAPPVGSIDLGTSADDDLGATLAVMWLNVRPESANGEVSLAVELRDPQFAQANYYPMMQTMGGRGMTDTAFPDGLPLTPDDWSRKARAINLGEFWTVNVTLPTWVRASDDYLLQFEIVTANASYASETGGRRRSNLGIEEYPHAACEATTTTSGQRTVTLRLSDMENQELEMPGPAATTTPLENNVVLTRETYTVDDWKAWLQPRSSTIALKAQATTLDGGTDPVELTRTRATAQNAHYHAYIAARLVKRTPSTVGE